MINILSNTQGGYAGEASLAGRQATLDSLMAQASQSGGNMSQLDLIRFQQEFDKFNREIAFQSTVIKVIGDSLKSILRNMS
jgi:hypothetical protein